MLNRLSWMFFKRRINSHKKISAIILSLGIALGVWGFRSTSRVIESNDLAFFDYFIKLKPSEAVDKKIVIVGMTEDDIRNLDTYPISDQKLAELLIKIKAQNPIAIGLDIIRDKPVEPGYSQLNNVFTNTPNLIGGGSILKDLSGQSIKFPQKLEELGQIGDIATPIDVDSRVRRGFLFTSSNSAILRSLSYELAFIYLNKTSGIKQKNSEINETWVKLKDTSFPWFQGSDGGYVFEANGDYNIIINWRKNPKPFKQVSFFEVIDNKIEENLFTDKIVLIGSTAPSVGDTFLTPLSSIGDEYLAKHFGVINIAHLTSQIVNAVLENRPLIKTLPDYIEFLQLWLIVLLTSFILVKVEANPVIFLSKIGLIILGGSCLIFFIHYFIFTQGYWLPFASIMWGMIVSGIVYLTWGLFQYREKKEVINKLNELMVNEFREPFFVVKMALLSFLPHWEKIAKTRQEKESLILLKQNLEKIAKIPDLLFPPLHHEILIKIPDFCEWLEEIVEKEITQKGFDKEVQIEIIQKEKLDKNLEIAEQIEFVVINLLKNSLESILEKKEKTDNIKSKIIIKAIESNQRIKLIIRDNGIGIKSSFSHLIFEPFYTTKKKNIGMGLYFCKEVMKKNRGSIDLSFSNKNETEFVLEFPYKVQN